MATLRAFQGGGSAVVRSAVYHDGRGAQVAEHGVLVLVDGQLKDHLVLRAGQAVVGDIGVITQYASSQHAVTLAIGDPDIVLVEQAALDGQHFGSRNLRGVAVQPVATHSCTAGIGDHRDHFVVR